MSRITKISPSNRKQFLDANKSSYIVLAFNAEFTGQEDLVNSTLEEISNDADLKNKVVLGYVDVEENNDYATELSVVSVPLVVTISDEKTIKKIALFESAALIKQLKEDLNRMSIEASGDGNKDGEDSFQQYLKSLISRAPVMVFMKGSPEAPRCGFSRQLVELLAKHDTKYETFDILQDEEVRQGLKELSNWPTYPQIYVKGEFIGGLDILKQLDTTGELKETLSV